MPPKQPLIKLEDLEQLVPETKPLQVLSVPAIALLLAKGYSQQKIATLFKVSRQAVNDYISRHSSDLDALRDFDNVMSTRLKHKVVRLVDSLDEQDLQKANLLQKYTSMGIGIEKIRLLQGQSTQNVQTLSQVAISLEAKTRGAKPQHTDGIDTDNMDITNNKDKLLINNDNDNK